ncbi:MAG: hypothetical protein AB1668_03995 [Nanoarchaeota archaeon]
MSTMNLLLTAGQRGSVNALAPLAKELFRRGHELKLYATGSETEAAGFNELRYERIAPADDDYSRLIAGYDAVITGLHGYNSTDGHFLRAANSAGIPTIAVLDQNSNYHARLGVNPADLPTLLAVMDEDCIRTMQKELDGEMGEEAARRSRVVGWTALDHYAKMRVEFTEGDRMNLLASIGVLPEKPVYLHCTDNVHPSSDYIQRCGTRMNEWAPRFNYELGITRFTFEAASDLGLKLVVKPHPGEEFKTNYTKELADRHGFKFVPARACNIQQLMLAACSVTAGRSTCLTEATLLDRNTAGILPDMKEEDLRPFPPLTLKAIPYTQEWEGIRELLELVTSTDAAILQKLAQDRQKFSVDGKASKRLADLVEELK